MKSTFRTLLIVAGVATAMASCTNNEETTFIPETSNLKTYQFITSAETRTALQENGTQTGGSFIWYNEAFDCFTFVKTTNANTTTSTAFAVNEGVANVTATLNADAAYSAVYPSACVVSNSNDDATKYKLILNKAQTNIVLGTAYSFDPATDILVAKQFTATSDNEEAIALNLKRLVAIGRMSIKNLNSTENIQSVEFAVNNKANLAGRFKANLTTGTASDYGYYDASNSVVVNYSNDVKNMAIDGKVKYPVWFSCFPVTLETGYTYTITVTTENKQFVKEGVIGANALNFVEGEITSFTANFQDITGTDLVQDGVDNLTAGTFDLSGTESSYFEKTFTSTTTYVSYYAQLSVNNDCIQLRSKDNNSGIVATANTKSHRIKNVVVSWNTSTTNGRTLDVYASNSPYTNATDLYDSNRAGDKVGSLTYTDSSSYQTTIEFGEPYLYIGMRSSGGALYLSNISIEYGDTYYVLAKPEIASFDVTAESLSASWSKVANATDYEWHLQVPNGESEPIIYSSAALGEVGMDASGANVTLSLTPTDILTGLTEFPEGEYVLYVKAVDTNGTYASSAEAEKSCSLSAGGGGGVDSYVEFDYTTLGASNIDPYTSTSLDQGITITYDKGDASTNPRYWANATELRTYSGNSITFAIESGNITKIEFTAGSKYNESNVSVTPGDFSDKVWTGKANSITFSVNAASSFYIKTVKVYYN